MGDARRGSSRGDTVMAHVSRRPVRLNASDPLASVKWYLAYGLVYTLRPYWLYGRIVNAHPDYIGVGSAAVVEAESGETETYVVVSPRDADPRAGRVSIESPIGRALLGRRVGEQVVVAAPGGSFTLTIEQVSSPQSQIPGP